MKLITLLSAGIIILLSCTSANKITSVQTPLYETNWSLKKMATDSGIEAVNTKAFIKFDALKQSAGGNGSCNSFGSNTSIEGDKISFKNIFSTKMYCVDVQQTEDKYFNLLGKANRFEIKNNLLLLYLDKEVLLEFVAE